jgi:hypothetical protein
MHGQVSPDMYFLPGEAIPMLTVHWQAFLLLGHTVSSHTFSRPL